MNPTGAHYILQTVCRCGNTLYQCKVYPNDGKIEAPIKREWSRQLCFSCRDKRKKTKFKLLFDGKRKIISNKVTA